MIHWVCRQYYEDHKNNYLTRKGIEAKIYTLKSSKGEKFSHHAYKKYSGKPDTDNRLIEKFNKKNDTFLIIKEGTWFKGDDPEIDKIQWITGSQSFSKRWFSFNNCY